MTTEKAVAVEVDAAKVEVDPGEDVPASVAVEVDAAKVEVDSRVDVPASVAVEAVKVAPDPDQC